MGTRPNGITWVICGENFIFRPTNFQSTIRGRRFSFLYAVSSFFFGVNFLFVKFLGYLTVVASLVLIYHLGTLLEGKSTGLLAATLLGITGMWRSINGAFLTTTENFVLLFSTLAIWVLVHALKRGLRGNPLYGQMVLAGFLVGISAAFKEVGLVTGATLVLWTWLTGKRSKKENALCATAITAGALLGTALSIVPLLLSGASLWDYLDGAWLILFRKNISGADFTFNDIRVDSFLRNWWTGEMHWFFPLLALLLVQKQRIQKAKIPFYPLLIWFAFDFIAVNASGVTHAHQLRQALPSLCIIGALALKMMLDSNLIPQGNSGRALAFTLLVIGVICMPWSSLRSGFRNIKHGKLYMDHPYFRSIGEWVKTHTRPEDEIYVFGRSSAAYTSLYAERRSASRHFSNSFIYGFSMQEQDKEAMDEVIRDISSHHPKLIMVPTLFTGEFEEPPARVPPWFQQLLSVGYTAGEHVADYQVYWATQRNRSVASGTK